MAFPTLETSFASKICTWNKLEDKSQLIGQKGIDSTSWMSNNTSAFLTPKGPMSLVFHKMIVVRQGINNPHFHTARDSS